MKPGDIRMIFIDPHNCESPVDQARLIKLKQDCGKLQLWTVEYLNEEGHYYDVLIKKEREEMKML